MMPAQHHLNLVQSFNPLRTALPIPKHDETLSAHAAMGFCIPICLLAEYLHVDLTRARWDSGMKVTIFRL